MSHRPIRTGLLLFLAAVAGYAVALAQETPAKKPASSPKGNAPTDAAAELKTLEDQVSYAIGLDVGRSILADKLQLKPDLVARGLIDALKKSPPLLTDEQIQQVMTQFTAAQQAKTAGETKSVSDKNLKDGEAFLAANKTKQGVQTTATGLQYLVVKSGGGADSPKATDVVKVHYHGTLIDGKVFDSSVERKEPAEFPVNRVIPGWTEALQKMKVGDKWRLFIPSNLAYGPRGTPGGPIPPNSVLVFDVELLEIAK
jgi:FKBP-type peptidyl-prolyl cis-trans isomerase